MKWFHLLALCLFTSLTNAADAGRNLYLYGTDEDDQPVPVIIDGIRSQVAIACVNCHRESGLGTTESGKTIPPVSWKYLGRPQQRAVDQRFSHIHNERPAYDASTLNRILVAGINSGGAPIDTWMPRYEVSAEQTESLLKYLQGLFTGDDPGVTDDTIRIATIVDSSLTQQQRHNHQVFLQGLFDMKNALTRGELKRKRYAPVQKAPQYESFRKWELVVWDLPSDESSWAETLADQYRSQPVFVVLAPRVGRAYQIIQNFCQQMELPCLFPPDAKDVEGDYYSFVFRDRPKQIRDFLDRSRRRIDDKLHVTTAEGALSRLQPGQQDIPQLGHDEMRWLHGNFNQICVREGRLLLSVGAEFVDRIYKLDCAAEQKLQLVLLADETVGHAKIAKMLRDYPDANHCWVSDYARLRGHNPRAMRVRAMVSKFGLRDVDEEKLAMDLYAFGLLSDSIHQLAGNFSRKYLLEIIEHMLNSFPNYTYFRSVSGAPYQRAIVGSLAEICPDGSQTS